MELREKYLICEDKVMSMKAQLESQQLISYVERANTKC